MTIVCYPRTCPFVSFGYWLFVLPMLTSAFSTACDAQQSPGQIHVILVSGGGEPQLGVEADLRHWMEEFNQIETYTGQKPKVTQLVGSKTSIEAVRKAIDELHVEENDTVLFYYGGHGVTINSEEATRMVVQNPRYNIAAAMRYPALRISDDETESLKLIDVYLSLFEKHPRLLLVIADCCDNYTDDTTISISLPLGTEADKNAARLKTDNVNDETLWSVEIYSNFITQRESPQADLEIALKLNYRRLYLEEKGAYIVSAAKVGEKSWGYRDSGGTFSNTLMALLRQTARTRVPTGRSSASWHMSFMGLCSSPLRTPVGNVAKLQTAQWDRAPSYRESLPIEYTIRKGYNQFSLLPEEFEAMAGTYRFPNFEAAISHEFDRLFANFPLVARKTGLVQAEKDTYWYRIIGADGKPLSSEFTLKFVKGQNGLIEKVVYTKDGKSTEAPKIK